MSEVVQVEYVGTHARVILNRPDVRNAFNSEMIATLRDRFLSLGSDDRVRTIELRGAGPVFSAGADLGWMRGALELTEDQNLSDASAMADMYRAIDECVKPVIGRVHRAAIAGGSGLCSVCDIVVAAEDAVFGFTETKLGILPAAISPFVICKIGVSQARALFLTGQRFDAARALAIGLVHYVVPESELDTQVGALLAEFASSGPSAVATAKQIIAAVARAEPGEAKSLTTRAIARARTSEEGQEGLRAFLEHRHPSWQTEPSV